MPAHHDVRAGDVVMRRLHGAFAAAADRGPADFSELLLVPGVGARTVRALAMVAEVVHGAPCRFSDPARFSLAHGGKDGHPFPVPLTVYDETIRVVKSALSSAKLGRDEQLGALKRLDEQARRARAARLGAIAGGGDREGAGACASLRRPHGFRMGAAAGGGELCVARMKRSGMRGLRRTWFPDFAGASSGLRFGGWHASCGAE